MYYTFGSPKKSKVTHMVMQSAHPHRGIGLNYIVRFNAKVWSLFYYMPIFTKMP